MELHDYKDALKIFAAVYKYRKVFNLAKIGSALRWFCRQKAVEQGVFYIAALQKYALMPTMFGFFILYGFCAALQYFFKTQNFFGAACIQLAYVIVAIIEAKLILMATPKIKIRISITGTV